MANIQIIQGDFEKKLKLQFAPGIKAGFPSPAEDYSHETLDFNRDLIRNPEATFYGKVEGDSMIEAGINISVFSDFFAQNISVFSDFFTKNISVFSDFFTQNISVFSDFFTKNISVFSDFFSKKNFGNPKNDGETVLLPVFMTPFL